MIVHFDRGNHLGQFYLIISANIILPGGKCCVKALYCPEIASHKSKTDESQREGDHGQKPKALGTIKRNGKEENCS